jgi:hypothetical protein
MGSFGGLVPLLTMAAGLAAGCQVEVGGLAPVTPLEDSPEPADGAAAPDPRQPPPRVTADAAATAPDLAPPSTGTDANTPAMAADAAPSPDTGPLPEPPATNPCDDLPRLPVASSYTRGVPASNDFTFDGDGYLLTFQGNDLVRAGVGSALELLHGNVIQRRGEGVSVLPDGRVVVSDWERDVLVSLAPGEGPRALSGRLIGPAKMAIGPGGKVFVAGQRRVYRFDPDTMGVAEVAEVPFNPNGIAFSLDYRTLYVSDMESGAIYSFDPSLAASRAQRFVGDLRGRPDGLATDECGNLYVVGWEDGVIHRIKPSGATEVAADLSRKATISSLAFGSGKQGWDQRSLYGVDTKTGGTWEIKIGVRAAPPPR